MPDAISLAIFDSPHGPVHVAVGDRGVQALELHTTDEAFRRRVARSGVAVVDPDDRRRRHLDRLGEEMAEYWRGARRQFDVPLELRVGSEFDRRILDAVRTIPFGATASYGEVARRAGFPRAARAAGGAVGRNPLGVVIPCHRVIAGDGTLGGYGGAWSGERDSLLALKSALLAGEGVRIRG